MRKQMLEFWYSLNHLIETRRRREILLLISFLLFLLIFLLLLWSPLPVRFRSITLCFYFISLYLIFSFIYLPLSLRFLSSFLFRLLSIPFEIIDQSTHSTPFNTLPPQKRIYINRTLFFDYASKFHSDRCNSDSNSKLLISLYRDKMAKNLFASNRYLD